MKNAELKSLDKPDEIRLFPKGRLELVKIGNVTVGRAVLEPGWKWSESVQPLAKTKSCEAPHFQYHGLVRGDAVEGTGQYEGRWWKVAVKFIKRASIAGGAIQPASVVMLDDLFNEGLSLFKRQWAEGPKRNR